MTRRELSIGRWIVEFYFATDGYDVDELLDRMYDFGASVSTMRQAMELMESGRMNTGFTFVNPNDYVAIIAIGPSDDGAEFIDSLVHEVHHLSVAIAKGLGVDLEGETPAYISGDSARELAQTICELGCRRCQ